MRYNCAGGSLVIRRTIINPGLDSFYQAAVQFLHVIGHHRKTRLMSDDCHQLAGVNSLFDIAVVSKEYTAPRITAAVTSFTIGINDRENVCFKTWQGGYFADGIGIAKQILRALFDPFSDHLDIPVTERPSWRGRHHIAQVCFGDLLIEQTVFRFKWSDQGRGGDGGIACKYVTATLRTGVVAKIKSTAGKKNREHIVLEIQRVRTADLNCIGGRVINVHGFDDSIIAGMH